MGAQFQRAERSGAKYAIVIGRDYPSIELKNMADRSAQTVPADELLDILSGLLDR
mgnify:FL=1